MNFLKSIVSTCQRDLLNYSNNFLVQSTQYQIQCAFLTVLTNIGQFRNSVTLESESNRFFQRIRSWSLKSEKRVSNSPIKKLRYFMYSIKQISKKQLPTRTHELNRVLNNFTLHLLLFSARLYLRWSSYSVTFFKNVSKCDASCRTAIKQVRHAKCHFFDISMYS